MSETECTDQVHNHRPYHPECAERRLSNGQLRGACLPDELEDSCDS